MHPGPRSRIPLFAAAVVTLAFGAHAAPVLEGQLPREMHRARRAAPVAVKITSGQPIHFPRELLPRLLDEFDADIQEPEGEGSPGLAPLRGRAEPRPDPLAVGPNHLLNNPVGDPPGATQSENTLAASGRFLVAGWNDSFDPVTPASISGFGYSSDGGRTWTDGGVLPRAGTKDGIFGDPNLVVDEDRNFYYSSLYSPDRVTLGVSVSRGQFHGSTLAFDPPVLAGDPAAGDLDKEWIAVDRKDGTLYVSYTRFFDTGGDQIELVRSTDQGRSWSAPVVITDRATEAVQGSRPIVGPEHELYVVYTVVDLTNFQAHMRIRKSMNRGRRFGPRANIGEAASDPGIFTNTPSGPPGFNRANGVELPSIAMDRSKGRDHGTLYVTWPEAVDFFDDPLATGAVVAEHESNNNPASATPFTPGDLLTGSYASSTDADWFKFTGTAGETVEFFLTPPQDGGGDGFLRLFCRNGDISDRLALSYFGGGQAFICFTLPSAGTYYLRALPINPQAKPGPYLIATGVHVPSPFDVAQDSRDVLISRSRDGLRWTRRARVNDDPPRYDNAFPEVAVDGKGDVHVVWYDHREDASFGIGTDLFHARSSDGAFHFAANERVNDGPATNWNLVPSRFAPNLGDYISLLADGDAVYAVWADGRLGSPDSWLAAVAEGEEEERVETQPQALAAQSDGGAGTPALGLRAASLGHAGQPLALGIALPEAGDAAVELYSVTGQHLRTLFRGAAPAGTQQVTWDARGRAGERLEPGIYFLLLRSRGREIARRVVMLP